MEPWKIAVRIVLECGRATTGVTAHAKSREEPWPDKDDFRGEIDATRDTAFIE